MKRFLIMSSSLMGLVLIVAVALFVYVQIALAPPPQAELVDETPPTSPALNATPVSPGQLLVPSAGESNAPTSPDTQSEPTTEKPSEPVSPTTPVLSKPIPLSSLPLTNTQKELLRSAGIDPETFIITPEMITCAQDRLGAARFAEIVAGDAPGPTEVFSLLRCL
jgi:hypothetical protein